MKRIKKKLNYKPNLTNYNQAYSSYKLSEAKKEIDYFKNGKLNISFNAVDRNALNWRKNKIALFWEDELGKQKKFTFSEISSLSCQFANVLKKFEVKKGDRVFIFLPRIPELFIAFLGIAKTGAIAGTLFAAFGYQALYDRLENSDAKILITDSQLAARLAQIIKKLPELKKIIITDDCNKVPEILKGKCKSFWGQMAKASEEFKICQLEEDDPAFMLYTSGTTGKPKGVVHSQRSIIHQHYSAKLVLDIKEDDVYWCTADPGWVTGIAYEILGSWSNGASMLIYSGKFEPKRWYQLIQDYKVSVWYTAPTAIRMLMAAGLDLVKKFDLSSLRHLASVGEPLNPQAVFWGMKAFGLPFHDNYWQTETGGIVIANFPCLDIKPGSMGKPVPGIEAEIVDDQAKKLNINQEGDLALKPGWPSMMLKIWRRPKKFKSYFKKGWYITGDRAYKDKDGYFWFISRADDVIKTAGERVGPFEVESALVAHPKIIEAAVIGKPDKLRGEIIKAFVTLAKEVKPLASLKEEIQTFVKKHLAGHAYPREIEFVERLPKTRSGKIMRRLLKAKELGLPLGDTSTLEEF